MKTLHKAGVVAAFGLFAGAASLPTVGVSMGSVPETGPGSKQCIRIADARNFAAAGERTLNVRANINEYYQLELAPNCQGLNFEQVVGLKGRTVNPYACEARDLEVLTSVQSGGRCEVLSMRRLSAEEVAALPAREKP